MFSTLALLFPLLGLFGDIKERGDFLDMAAHHEKGLFVFIIGNVFSAMWASTKINVSSESSLGWNDYLTLILRHYADKPDDYTITIGDMSGGDKSLPEYRGFMQMRLGDLRSFRIEGEDDDK
jgi:hypothetical protein